MIRTRKSRTVKQQFRLWMIAVTLLLSFSVNLAFYMIYQQDMEKSAYRDLNNKLGLQSLLIESWMRERAGLMRSVAAHKAVVGLDKPAMPAAFRQFLDRQEEFASLVFVNTEGVTEVDTNAAPGVVVSDRAYFKAARQGLEYMSGVITGKTSGEPIVIFSVPTYGYSGEWTGLVFGSVRLQTIQREFGFSGEDLTEFYMVDRQGAFITLPKHIPREQMGIERLDTEISRKAKNEEKITGVYTNYRGDAVFGAYRWVNTKQWLIVGEISRSDALSGMYAMIAVFVVLTIAIMLVGFALVVRLARRIEEPLESLLQATEVMKEGGYDYRIDPEAFRLAPLELRELCDTYNLMGEKLQSTVKLLEEHALIDPLTGLHNRRYMMEAGGARLLETLRSGSPCSVLMIDIDYFKKVNDTCGHLTGDRVLRHVAGVLGSSIGDAGMLVRYGGEEFMLLLLGSDEADSASLAESLRRTVAAFPFRREDLTVPLSVSIGGMTGRTADAAADRVMERMIASADEALYRAKREGRNRVEWSASSAVPVPQ